MRLCAVLALLPMLLRTVASWWAMPRRAFVAMLPLLAAGWLLTVATPAPAHDRLGANLNGIGDYRRNHEFADLIRQSRRFLRIGTYDDADAANLVPIGNEGWPTTDFRVLAMADQGQTLDLAGTYRILFNGRASLSTGPGAGTLRNATYDAATDSSRADLDFPAGGDLLIVDFAGTQGSVRNLRIIRPGLDPDAPPLFTPRWENHVRRFAVLRFMDWTRTNGNRQVSWVERTTPERLRTEAVIASWETVVAAANRLGRDAWINVPVRADDDYVRALATLLRDRLDPELKVWVEYGNELRNFGLRDVGLDAMHGGDPFNGATVNRDLVAASTADSPLRYDGATDATTLGFRRVALRLFEISAIFRDVFGAPAINTRVRPVLSGQMANAYVVDQGLRLVDEGLGVRPDTVFYAIAGAPYVFASARPDGEADELPGLTAAQILAGLAVGVAHAPDDGAYQYLTHAGLGAWYGLKVVAYEAGFDSFGSQNVAAKRLANLDPAIRPLCRALIDQWHAHGFEQLLWFSAGADRYDTPYGMWPLAEDLGNPAVPKNQCVDDVLGAALPALTIGAPVGRSPIAGGNYRGSGDPAGPLTGRAASFGYPGHVEYLLRAPASGRYELVFRGTAAAGTSFRARLNQATVAERVDLPATDGSAAPLTVSLRQGLNALRIERAVGVEFSLTDFTLTALDAAGPGTPVASPGAVDFGGQSIGTTSPTQRIVVTAVGGPVTVAGVTVTGVTAGAPFAVTHDCGALAEGAGCAIDLRFAPTTDGAFFGTLAVASDGGDLQVPLAGTGERSLVTHYYQSILGRAPDAGGKAYWEAMATTVPAWGASRDETWFAMAMYFLASAEYRAFRRDDAGFVADLYRAFFNRAPDPGGLAFWVGSLDRGLPREVALAGFLFSPEFGSFTAALFGAPTARAEADLVMDFYRGLLARLPDAAGFAEWLARLRAAQCHDAAAVVAVADTVSRQFVESAEYQGRRRTNAEYVGDLYNAFLRRGGEEGGVAYWIGQLTAGTRSREQLRAAFRDSAEFAARTRAVNAEPCLP